MTFGDLLIDLIIIIINTMYLFLLEKYEISNSNFLRNHSKERKNKNIIIQYNKKGIILY